MTLAEQMKLGEWLKSKNGQLSGRTIGTDKVASWASGELGFNVSVNGLNSCAKAVGVQWNKVKGTQLSNLFNAVNGRCDSIGDRLAKLETSLGVTAAV